MQLQLPHRLRIRPATRPRVKLQRPARWALRSPGMTVCTACIFPWFCNADGEPPDIGGAIVAATDRMYSDLGLSIEYEASKWKMSLAGPSHLFLISGDMAFQSEVLLRFHRSQTAAPVQTAHEMAYRLGDAVAEVRRERAARRVLHPVGLTEETFLSQQMNLQPSWVRSLSEQMQDVSVEADSIVAGVDGAHAHLFHVDGFGTVTNHSDMGFVSAGVGGVHSSAQLMRDPYNHRQLFGEAAFKVFRAKKRAEVAPGVGPTTDLFLINRHGFNRLSDEYVTGLGRFYDRQELESVRFLARSRSKIDDLFSAEMARVRAEEEAKKNSK